MKDVSQGHHYRIRVHFRAVTPAPVWWVDSGAQNQTVVQCRDEISKGQNVGSRDAAEGAETVRNTWMERTHNTSDRVDMQPRDEEEGDLQTPGWYYLTDCDFHLGS